MSDLRPVPTLDQVAAEPERAQALSAPAAFGLLSRCLTAQAALLARLGGALNEHAEPAPESAQLETPSIRPEDFEKESRLP